jgi:D-arabinose 1-dehydrogenase-like Zn-dependent alcohol dehydrogenase
MRAVVYDDFGAEPEVRTVPDPVPSPHGAVIRVEATGLCRSDWHGWRGHDPDVTRDSLPHVPGHEVAGIVEVTGDSVTGWQPGDRVIVPFIGACGRCASCVRGEQQICERQTQPGFTHWGSFAEYVQIDNVDLNLIPLPAGMSMVTAASLGCRFATAFRAVTAQGRVAPGEWVAVHGCGGVGLSAIMIASQAGARVVAVDISPPTLALAEELGATVTVDASTTADVAEAIVTATGGGAELSLDALGYPETCAASIRCLRRQGRHIQLGVLPVDPPVPMHRVMSYELAILGSHGMASHAYPRMLDMIDAGILRPDRLITRTIGLDDAPHALATMDSDPLTGVTVIIPRTT